MQDVQVKSVEQFEKKKAGLYFYLNLHSRSGLLGTLYNAQPVLLLLLLFSLC